MNRQKNATQNTQPGQVLSYLRSRGHITQATASAVLGCSRLAAVIYRLKQEGHNIETKLLDGVRGRYAEYHLIKEAKVAA